MTRVALGLAGVLAVAGCASPESPPVEPPRPAAEAPAASAPSATPATLDGWTRYAVPWVRTSNGEFPYSATVDGHDLVVRVGDFPNEPLYTLIVDGEQFLDIEDWPAAWARP